MATGQELVNADLNLETLNEIATSTEETATNRIGVGLLTFQGFTDRANNLISTKETQFDEAINNLGLEYPPISYTPGLTVERNTQTYRYNDVIYINTRSDLPFTTTGSFDEGGWQIVQQVNQSTVIFTADGIKGLENVALIDRAAYSVSGFYASTETGGGKFIYDASRDKSDHDGVLVISPEAISAWDGTQPNISVLHNWTGVGNGCFVRLDFNARIEYAGAVSDGFVTDNRQAIQAAINSAESNGLTQVHFGEGQFLTEPGIVANTYIELVGVEALPQRNYNMPTQVKFNDDQSVVAGRVGVTFGSTWQVKNIQWLTLSDDARNASGDFIGLTGDGRNHVIENCIIRGFKEFCRLKDIGYAYHLNLLWRGCNKGVYHQLDNWVAGTTLTVRNSIAVQCINVYDVPFLYHSSWESCTYEFCEIAIVDFRDGCSFTNMYGEGNSQYTVYSSFAADAVFCRCYANGENDDYVIDGTTQNYGFDRIGATEISRNFTKSRQHYFYDRSGNAASSIKCSGNTEGKLEEYDPSGTLKGQIPNLKCSTAAGLNNNVAAFYLNPDTGSSPVGGIPSGWSCTKTGVGSYNIEFGANIRTPMIQITMVDSNAAGGATDNHYWLQMTESSSGVWDSFQNADGFNLELYINGSLSDGVGAFVTVIFP